MEQQEFDKMKEQETHSSNGMDLHVTWHCPSNDLLLTFLPPTQGKCLKRWKLKKYVQLIKLKYFSKNN